MAANPTQTELERRLEAYIAAGYGLIRHGKTTEGCDQWSLAWEVVKQLVTADTRSIRAFDRSHRGLSEYPSNWCQDFEMELGNAGHDAPLYHEARVRYAREFLALFPDESSLLYLNMRRAEGEALWALDRRTEAEAVYNALVERLPDEAWGYIAWADLYWLLDDSPKEYERAESIMQRGLERPNLQDRADMLERLASMYEAWGKPAESEAAQSALEALRSRRDSRREALPSASPELGLPTETMVAPPKRKLGRNDRCWCGSGVKYKQCHLRADRQSG